VRFVCLLVVACASIAPFQGCDDESGDDGSAGSTAAPDGATDGGSETDLGVDATIVDACVPVAEICNGVDDDCDGLGDESLSPPPADRTEGICGLFFKQCAGPDGWIEPNYRVSPEYQAEEDLCDGQDNDCDGTVDENLDPPAVSGGVGVCEGVVQVCVGVTGYEDPDWATIMDYEAREMTCDGLDNDCDGMVDEGLAGCMP